MRRRTVYWLGGILFVVLQIDFWIAPWPSRLSHWSLIGATILTFAYVADTTMQFVVRNRAEVWRTIKRLRHD